MSDQYASYGDDGPAYGDDGPAYGDDGPAYGDEGPAYAAPSYDDEAVYGDEGPIGEGQPAYEDEQAYGEYADQGFAEDLGSDQLGGEEPAPGRGPRARPNPKRLAMMGAALLGLLGVGGAGYMVLAGGDDPLAMLRGLPMVGDLLGPATPPAATAAGGKDKGAAPAPAPAAEEGGGVMAWFKGFLPGSTDSDDTMLLHADNLTALREAITAYDKEHNALPSTAQQIMDKAHELGYKPMNPYSQGQTLKIDLGDLPKGPGNVAYAPKKGAFQLRVGDKAGQPLHVKGVELILEGTGSDTVADAGSSEAPKVAASPKPEPSAQVALLPKPKDSPGAKGIDRLGGVIPPGASPLPSAGPPGGPPQIADAGQVPIPGGKLTDRQLFELRVKRNREFDFWRVKGISLIYSKRTTEALDAFKKALAIRPNDESVTQWVNSINEVIDKRDKEAREKYEEEKALRLKEAAGRSGTSSAYVPPPPVPRVPDRPAPKPPTKRDGGEDASKMLEELKKADKGPMLAPPKLDP